METLKIILQTTILIFLIYIIGSQIIKDLKEFFNSNK